MAYKTEVYRVLLPFEFVKRHLVFFLIQYK